MAYIGSTPTSQSFIAGTDTFSGTGSQTAFTLSRSVNSVNDILVVVNNVDQQPSSYSAAGTALTFSSAPSSGTGNIYVRYLSTTLTSIAPSQKTVVPASLSTGGPYWDTSGNVGIGTTSPSTTLDVSGTLKVSGITALNGGLNLSVPNASIELGSSTINTPYIDFHSSANSLDYDARIIASGGTASNGNGTLTVNSSLFQFNSGYGSAATAYGCRAWVNFNGTGTVAIRASGNVSSVTDNGVGEYTVNFATAMPDANYTQNINGNMNYGATLIASPSLNTAAGGASESAPTTTSLRVYFALTNTTAFDPKYVNASIFR